MKVSELPDDKLVGIYIELRDRRSGRKAAFENEDMADKGKQEKIEGILMARFLASGLESIKTAAGTAYKSIRTSATVASGPEFLTFCLNDNLGLLDVRALKSAVVAYREEHDDLPPGLNWREDVTINVRRS